MRFSWMILLAALLTSDVVLAAEATRTVERRPDGSVASVHEVEPLPDGGSRVTHTTYLVPVVKGEVRIVMTLNARGQTTWVQNQAGEQVAYARDEHDRIIQVTWGDRVYSLAYDVAGTVTAIRFPDPAVKAGDFKAFRWSGLALVGEVRDTGEWKILIPVPTAIPGDV